MEPKFVIRTSIGRILAHGTITPHALGVLKLTLEMRHCHNDLDSFSSTRHQNSSSGSHHRAGNNVNPRPLQRNEEYIEFELEGQTQADG